MSRAWSLFTLSTRTHTQTYTRCRLVLRRFSPPRRSEGATLFFSVHLRARCTYFSLLFSFADSVFVVFSYFLLSFLHYMFISFPSLVFCPSSSCAPVSLSPSGPSVPLCGVVGNGADDAKQKQTDVDPVYSPGQVKLRSVSGIPRWQVAMAPPRSRRGGRISALPVWLVLWL